MRRSFAIALLALVGSPALSSVPAMQSGAPEAALTSEQLLRQATAAFESGEMERASRLYAQMRQREPGHPAGWFGGGLVAEARGDLGTAIAQVARAAELDPDRGPVHLAHGRLLARIGASAPALAAFERARRYAPKEPNGYLFAALLLRDAGSYEQAEALLRQGIADAEPRPEFWDQLGLVLLSQKKPEEALQAVEESLSRYAATPRLELVRGLALAELPGRRGDAIAALERAVTGNEGGARGRLRLAELLLADERLDPALEYLEQAVEIAPQDPQAHYLLGQAFRQAGRAEEAGRALERFEELRTERDEAGARAKRLGSRFNVAIDHVQAGRLEEALAAVEEILAETPEHARTLALKAKVLFSQGDLDGAYRAAVDARANDATLSEHHYLVGLFAYHSGRLNEAREALETALALEPDLGEAHEVAAIVALRLEQPAQAVAHFERALALGVDHEQLRKAYAIALEAAKPPDR